MDHGSSRIMEAPATLEDGNAPQSRRSVHLRVAFWALIFVLIIVSAQVPIVFCLLYHQQAPESCWAHGSLNESSTQTEGRMKWNWKLQHCNGMVQVLGQDLLIQQSGRYFIYAQLYRYRTRKAPFVLMIYKDSKTLLNHAVGHDNGTIYFARPFFLHKGEKLLCMKNDKEDYIELRNQTYWGLIKM